MLIAAKNDAFDALHPHRRETCAAEVAMRRHRENDGAVEARFRWTLLLLFEARKTSSNQIARNLDFGRFWTAHLKFLSQLDSR